MKRPHEVIKGFRITEKANQRASELNQYTFEVYRDANSIDVGYAIGEMFKVTVENVNMLNLKGKVKRSRTQRGKFGKTSDVKQAIVTLKRGDKIEIN
jgi:large subunit ribosomal protein L23